MKPSTIIVGRRGEDAAAERLRQLGHIIVERNWRCSHLEVDIITIAPDGMHFVEVKTRTAPAPAAPELNVNYKKQRNIINAARRYVYGPGRKFWSTPSPNSKPEPPEIFFDIVSAEIFPDRIETVYFPKAYLPWYI